MGNEIQYGIKLTTSGGAQAGAEVKSVSDSLNSVGTAAGNAKSQVEQLNNASKNYSVTSKETAEFVMGMSIAESNAKDKAWALANGYKEVEGQLVKVTKASSESASGAKVNALAMRESLVLVREAVRGNYTRMAGSASILAQSLGVMGALFSPIGIAVAGTAVALGALFVAAESGRREIEAMDNTLLITGNYAGTTSGQMRTLAQDISASGNISISSAKEITTALVSSGQIGGQALSHIAELSASYAAATHQDISKVGADLVKMFSDPAKGAEALNNQWHLLNATEMEHINHLVRIGEEDQAQIELADKLKERLSGVEQNLGLLDKAWMGIKGAAASAWDAMEGAGRQKTANDYLAQAQQKLADLQGGGIFSRQSGSDAEIAAQKKVVENYQWVVDQKAKEAKRSAEVAANNSESIKAQNIIDKALGLDRVHAIEDQITRLDADNAKELIDAGQYIQARKKLTQELYNAKHPKTKADPQGAWQASVTKSFSDMQQQATGKTDGLTQAQIKLKEVINSPQWAKSTDQWKRDTLEKAANASATQENEAATKAASAAQDEANKIIDKAKASSAARIEQIQFETSLIGKSALEVQLLTEKHKAELDAKQKLLALDMNPKFKSNDPAVQAAKKSASDVITQNDAAAEKVVQSTIITNDKIKSTWQTGGQDAATKYFDNVNNAATQSATLVGGTLKGTEDTLTKLFATGKASAQDFENMFGQILARMAAQKAMSGIGSLFNSAGSGAGMLSSIGSFFGFADGGIMTPSGPLPLRTYANGGVANSPQLTLFGEGRTPEAYVPLPDGRSIPVSFQGAPAAAGQSSGVMIQVVINPQTGQTQTTGNGSANLNALGQKVAQQVRAVIADEMRPGGMLQTVPA